MDSVDSTKQFVNPPFAQEVDEGFKYPFGETRALGAVTKEEEDWAKGFMQPEKKFQEGGQVQEYRGGGTISDYFGMQGKSLGGSNKQSLAEILGRK
jgi:flavin-dependent dehydrogenase